MTTPLSEPPSAPPPRPLLRSRDDRVVAGVAGGLGRWLDVDPVIFRVTFAVLTLFGGLGVIGYLVGYLLIPDEESGEALVSSRLLPDLRKLTHQQRTVLGWGLVVLAVLVVGAGYHSSTVVLLLIVAGVVALTTRGHQHQRTYPAPSVSSYPPAQEYAFAPPPGTEVPPSAPFAATPGTATGTAAPETAAAPVWYGRRARSRTLNGALISSSVLAMGIYLLIGRAGAYDTSALQATAVGLVALGIGLVATAWRARSRWALTLGALMTAFVMLGSVVHSHWGTAVGTRVWRPATASSIPYEYQLGAGNATLDLRAVGTDVVGKTVRVRIGAGRLRVIVPSSVPAAATGYVELGVFEAFGARYNDNPTRQTVVSPGWTTPAQGVRIVVHMGAGHTEVQHG